MKLIITFVLLITTCALQAQQQPDRQQFIRAEAPVVALTHVRVIDGTGAAAMDDQTLLISDRKIQRVGSVANVNICSKRKDSV